MLTDGAFGKLKAWIIRFVSAAWHAAKSSATGFTGRRGGRIDVPPLLSVSAALQAVLISRGPGGILPKQTTQ